MGAGGFVGVKAKVGGFGKLEGAVTPPAVGAPPIDGEFEELETAGAFDGADGVKGL